ncbi:MAG: HD domain-containing protein [Lachnospiraceae bacterium]|nr:HD domain-containing protein [Lachnospiraceae bacterium]
MTVEQQYDLALKIATKAHEGQLDKSGVAYIEHPKAVAEFCKNPRAKVVALLHDTIEDTYVTEEYLREQGFDEDIIRGVVLVTKWEGFNEQRDTHKYLSGIKADPLAREVKMGDLLHNMDPTRVIPDMELKAKKTRFYYREFLYLYLDDMKSYTEE